ncbi:hypothetical protein BD289DRAFT_422440 [Coniella lustricola]|uniref:Uncharacterized protein n=1 Tax=Coniella lustricola TaxID=2025994 RepID=A0A2T3AL58_9PEZI|nr:hypothetical protein BD289DRAFT_422440 [Coniella lustricola]
MAIVQMLLAPCALSRLASPIHQEISEIVIAWGWPTSFSLKGHLKQMTWRPKILTSRRPTEHSKTPLICSARHGLSIRSTRIGAPSPRPGLPNAPYKSVQLPGPRSITTCRYQCRGTSDADTDTDSKQHSSRAAPQEQEGWKRVVRE